MVATTSAATRCAAFSAAIAAMGVAKRSMSGWWRPMRWLPRVCRRFSSRPLTRRSTHHAGASTVRFDLI